MHRGGNLRWTLLLVVCLGLIRGVEGQFCWPLFGQWCPVINQVCIYVLATPGVCVYCPAGTQQPNPYGLACSLCQPGTGGGDCSACAAGTYQVNANDHAACTACPAGTAAHAAGSSVCQCDAGYGGTGYVTTTAHYDCTACGLGYYKSQCSNVPCTQCLPGWTTFSPGATVCSCPAGGYIYNATTCAPCVPGTYSSTRDVFSCTACPANTLAPSPGATVCGTCPTGLNLVALNGLTCECDKGYQPMGGRCAPCPAGTYKDVTGNGTACQPCPTNTYSLQPGAASVSLCACAAGYTGASYSSCVQCSAGTFKSWIGFGSCNGSCGLGMSSGLGLTSSAPCTSCGIGTYQALVSGGPCVTCPVNTTTIAGGAGSLSLCICPAGRGDVTKQCPLCPIGTYKGYLGGGLCTGCGQGNTTLTIGNTVASACSLCGPNLYQPTSGGACVPCPANSVFTGSGAISNDQCLCTQSYDRDPATGSQTCRPCVQGFYKSGTSNNNCTACPAHILTRTTGANSSVACNLCDAVDRWGHNCSLCNCTTGSCLNTFESPFMCSCYNGTGFSGPQCSNCTGNWWGPGCNKTCSCNVLNGACDAGLTGTGKCQFCFTPGYALPTCTSCALGYMGARCDSCIDGYGLQGGQCIQCTPGYYHNASVAGQTTCQPCPAGTAQNAPGANSCNVCSAGYFAASGSPTCTQCTASGSYSAMQSPTLGAAGCVPCPAGYIPTTPLQSTCVPCDKGTYADIPGRSSCKDCPQGTHQNQTGQSGCDACDPGFTATGGAINCCPCGPGSYAPSQGMSQCISCELGSIQPLQGQSTCVACAEGNYSLPIAGQTECQMCPPGSYTNAVNQTSCMGCTGGNYQADYMATRCNPCGIGTAVDAPNAAFCPGCLHNEYQSAQGQRQCLPCPVGYSTGKDSATLFSDCQPCPVSSYIPDGSADCIQCPGNQITLHGASTDPDSCGCIPGSGWDGSSCQLCAAGYIQTTFGPFPCTICPEGTYFVGFDVVCAPCPIGGVCLGGNIAPTAQDGWWHDPALGGYGYSQCIPAGVCVNDSKCLEGQTGPRCATCCPGWYKNEETLYCYHCPPAVPLIITALCLLCILLSAFLVRLALKNAYIFACATVGFNFLQAIAVLPSFNVHWPDFLTDFYNIVTILNVDLHIFTPECMVRNGVGAYYYVYALKLLSPLLFALFILLIYAGVCLTYLYRKKFPAQKGSCFTYWFPNISDQELVRFRHAHINAYLSVLIFLYLMLASTALEIYPCDLGLDGMYTMHRDPVIYCYSPQWYQLVGASVAAIAIYVVGLPVLLLIVLIRRRRNLHKDKNVVRLGMLYLRYQPQQYFFELCVLLRKFGILSGKILFGTLPMGQVVVAFLTLLIASIVQYRYKPYRSPRVNRLEALHLTCATFVLFLGILFVALEKRLSMEASDIMGIVIIVIITLNFVAIVVAVVLELRYNQMLAKHGVSGRFASDRIDVSPYFFDWGMRLVRQTQSQFSAVGLAHLVDVNEYDSRSTLVTLQFESARPMAVRAQVASADLTPKPAASPGSGCIPRMVAYTRSLKLSTIEGKPSDQIAESTPDEMSHTITMIAKTAGLYEAIIYAMPTDGKFQPPSEPGPIKTRFFRCFDAGYDRKLVRSEKLLAFANSGAQVVMTINLTVAGQWTENGTNSMLEPLASSANPVFTSHNENLAVSTPLSYNSAAPVNTDSINGSEGARFPSFSSGRVMGGLFAVELQSFSSVNGRIDFTNGGNTTSAAAASSTTTAAPASSEKASWH